MSKKKHQVATHRDIAVASAYLASNRERVTNLEAAEVCSILKEEEEVSLPPEKVKEICGMFSIPLKKRKRKTSSTRTNRTRIVAKALRDLMEVLEYEVPEEIAEIVRAKGEKEK